MRALAVALTMAGILSVSGSAIADDLAVKPPFDVLEALRRGLDIVQKGAANYPEHRQCFSCHHQTLPLLAMDAARKAGAAIDEKLFQTQVRFTHDAFARRHEDLLAGEGIGGKTLTVDYALWAFDVAHEKPDETTAAMVAYLLKTQEPDGHWPRQSLRPPLSESLVTATVLAADFARKFAAEAQKEAAENAVARAEKWLAEVKLECQEDFAFRLWGMKLLGADEESQRTLRSSILARQGDDGGWSQMDGMSSDAYSTGQTLFVLHESGLSTSAPEYQRGVRFLLNSQHADGSWFVESRAKPVQVFFDNGDPHGKHQFISISATAWAVTAIAADQRRDQRKPE